MSAEMLREAAALMRERAEAATPGPWHWTDSEVVNDVWDGGMVIVNANRDPIANSQDEWYEADPGEPAPVDDATHIASWHPTVALAVADWLDQEANLDDVLKGCGARGMTADSHSVIVATAYLGTPA